MTFGFSRNVPHRLPFEVSNCCWLRVSRLWSGIAIFTMTGPTRMSISVKSLLRASFAPSIAGALSWQRGLTVVKEGGGGEGRPERPPPPPPPPPLERPSLCLHPIPASNTPTHQHTNTPTHKKRQQKQDPRRVSDHTTDRRLISVRVGYDAVFKERQRGFEFRYGRVGHQDQVQQTKTSSGKCGIGAALSTCKTGLTGLGT